MRRRNEKPPDSSSSTPLNSSPSATPPPKEARLSKEEEKNPVPETRPHSNPFRVNPDSPSSSTTSSTTSMTQTQTQVRFYPDINKRFKAGILDGTSMGTPISQSIQEDPFSYPNYQDYPMDWGIQQSLLSSFGYLNQGIPPSMLYPQQGVPFQAIPFFDSSSSTMSETAGEDSLDPRIAYSIREESDESPENDPLTASDGLFVLREQPKPKQRKSYKKENRYLLPNPTQIIPGESRKKSPEPSDIIESGICKVSLVDGSGNKLKKETNHYLEDTEGSLVKPFDAELGCFNFTLKIRQNSGPDKFRLCFRVKYKTADGVDHKERIVSNPFLVQSNKSFFSKDPKLKGIHPATGIHDKPNEVWIKGRDFNEKGVVVKVDGIEANILEIQPNLIIALTPVREEMTKSKVVKVSVSNLFKQKMVHSEQHFQFTYLVPTDGMLPCDSVFKRSGSPLVASKENSS